MTTDYEREHPVLYEVLRYCIDYLPRIHLLHSYLEIGVREGVSLNCVLDAAEGSITHLVLCDLWGEHSGPSCRPEGGHIREQLRERGFKGSIQVLSGSSHDLIKTITQTFDLILVDGDHTAPGVRQDAEECWPLLNVGGIMVFDDCWNPSWPGIVEEYASFLSRHRDAIPFKELRDAGSGTCSCERLAP